jgi:hypothetical protein
LHAKTKICALIIIGPTIGPQTRPKKPAKKQRRAAAPKNLADFALQVGVSKRTLEDYFARGCPRGSVAEVQQWRADNLAKRAVVPPPGETAGPSLADLQRAKCAEEVRAKRLKNDLAEGQLLRRDAADRVLAELCLRVKARLEALPDELEMLLPADVRSVVKRDIDDKLRLVLKEMSAWTFDPNSET